MSAIYHSNTVNTVNNYYFDTVNGVVITKKPNSLSFKHLFPPFFYEPEPKHCPNNLHVYDGWTVIFQNRIFKGIEGTNLNAWLITNNKLPDWNHCSWNSTLFLWEGFLFLSASFLLLWLAFFPICIQWNFVSLIS